MRRLLGKPVASVRAEGGNGAEGAASVGDTTYPTYGEAYTRSVSPASRETRPFSGAFGKAVWRGRHTSWDGPESAAASGTDTPRDPANVQGAIPAGATQDDSTPSKARNRSPALFSWKRGALKPRQPTESAHQDASVSIALQIGQNNDWANVLALGDTVNATAPNSKEAIHALRHELRGTSTHAQSRAVRAWGMWSMSAGGTFGVYATHPPFLATLEDVLVNPRTPAAVREDIVNVLGEPLQAPLFGGEQEPLEAQIGQLELADERPEPAAAQKEPVRAMPTPGSPPPAIPRRSPWRSVSQGTPAVPAGLTPGAGAPPSAVPSAVPFVAPAAESLEHAPVPTAAAPVPITATPAPIAVAPASDTHRASPSDRIAGVFHECQLAHTYGARLLESLSFANPTASSVQEHAERAQTSQDTLLTHLPWATEHVEEQTDPTERTAAEALLADVLDALSTVGDALAVYEREFAPHADPAEVTVYEDAPADSPTDQPSAKALGKRRAFETPDERGSPHTPR